MGWQAVRMDKTVELKLEGGTLVNRVMHEVRQRIAGRALTPGAKLPSIRSFAETLSVSKSTIVEAYDRLAAEGIILSRRGSGFYVAGHLPPLSLAEIGPRLDHAIDPLWVSRTSLDANNSTAKPGCGWLPSSWMPEAGIRRALRAMARADEFLPHRLCIAVRVETIAPITCTPNGWTWH